MTQTIWSLQSSSNDPGPPNDEVLIIFTPTPERKKENEPTQPTTTPIVRSTPLRRKNTRSLTSRPRSADPLSAPPVDPLLALRRAGHPPAAPPRIR